MPKQVDFTGHRVRPPEVLRAVLTNDTAALSEFGRRGAAARKRRGTGPRLAARTATEIRQHLLRVQTTLGVVHDLRMLQRLWLGVVTYLKPYRGRLTPAILEQEEQLNKDFVARAEWIDRESEIRAELEALAIECNEHICPID